jgi:hypothetical protein
MLADMTLFLHAAVVLFNVGGMLLILTGGIRGWRWVRRRGFRTAHVGLMAVVTVEAILGVTCPLTTLEDWLRGAGDHRSFVGRWLFALLYWDAPAWVFAAGYGAFLALIVWAWRKWPPDG